ncbi:MAG: glycosyltransferase family 9 protein [Candidatus Bruticola sp.]
MKISTMRILDQWVGVPLCTLARLSSGSIKRSKLTQEQLERSILIIHLSEMGAMVLAQPAIDYLKRSLPNTPLYFVGFPPVTELLSTLKVVPDSNLLTLDTSNFTNLVKSGINVLRRLRAINLGGVIDCEGFSRASALLSFLACPRGFRLGWHPYSMPHLYRGDLLTHRVQYNCHQHASQAYLTLFSALWADPSQEPFPQQTSVLPLSPSVPLEFDFKYHSSEEDKQYIDSLLEESGVSPNSEIIIVNPNSSDMLPLRKWPLEKYAAVLHSLFIERPQLQVVVTGTASEKPGALKLKSQMVGAPIHDFTGKTSLAQLLALYDRSKLLLTNDSGPAHLASIVNLPSVVLYGPETPALFSPLGHKTKIVYDNWICSPCVSPYNGKNSLCRTGGCLRSISPEKVLQAVQEQLKS